MLFTPAVAYLSLTFNFGTLLFFHGRNSNLVTTQENFQRSIQTIELTAKKSWSNIAAQYEGIFSPPPDSSASFSFVDRAEWIYRSCAVRILCSLDGSTPHSSRTSTPSSLPPSFSPLTIPSTSPSTPVSTDIILYIPVPPTCLISSAPFVVDYFEHTWKTPGFIEVNFPRLWPSVLCILVCLVNCVWLKACRHVLDTEIEPTYEAHSNGSVLPSFPYIGSVVTSLDMDSTFDSNSGSGIDSEPWISTTTVDISSLPHTIPVIVTTSNGQVLFNAEISLSSNHIISTSPSSVKFFVEVAAFRNLSSSPEDVRTTQNDDNGTDRKKSATIPDRSGSDVEPDTSCDSSTAPTDAIVYKIEDSEEAVSIVDAAEESISVSEQIINNPTEDMEVLRAISDSTTTEVTLGPCIDWSTEDIDIGEPPVCMLAGIEVDDNDGWQISVNGRHGGHHKGNRTQSDSRLVHESTSKSTQSASGMKDWLRKDGMGVPGSFDLSARTGLYPIYNRVPAGSGPTARSNPLFIGGEDPAGCDQTATSPSSENGDGVMPSPSIQPDGILNCHLASGDASGGGVLSAGAGGVVGTVETISECSDSAVSPDQSLLPSTSPSPSATASPSLSSSLSTFPSVGSAHASIFVPGPVRHLIAADTGDYSGQPRRVIIDNIDSSSVVVADPTSTFSCRLLEDALRDLEIEATGIHCFDGRVVGGVARYGVSYAVLDFSTHMDALIAFRQLGSYDPERKWLAQFSDPKDETFDGRMVRGLLPFNRSAEDLQALQDLAVLLDLCEN